MKIVFNRREVAAIKKLYHEAEEGTFARRLAEEILPPLMPLINIYLTPNGSLVTENDPMFIAYKIEKDLMEGKL